MLNMSVTKRILSILATAVVLLAMTVFLTAPAHYAQSIQTGISLWAVSVLPATFPFLFLTALLTKLRPYSFFSEKLSPLAGRLFRISGAGSGAAILSALSGYPVGARMVSDLYCGQRIAKTETFRLACLCSTSGPMFLVGTVGCMMYGSAKTGWIMLFSHLFAVWLVCFFLRFTAKPVRFAAPPPIKPSENALSDSLWSAVVSILCVGGFIALFACFGQMLSDLGVFAGISALLGGAYAEGVCRGLMEMTTGCAFLSSYATPLSCALSAAIVTFGGLCVLCQQTAYLSRAGVRILPFLGVKLLQAVIAFWLCLALCTLLGV